MNKQTGIIAGLLLALLAQAGAAFGADEAAVLPAFTLEECIGIGLKQAASARNADRDEQIAGTRINQVRAQVLPELKAKGGYTRLDEAAAFEFDGESVAMGLEDNYTAGIEASQLLYSGGSVRSALKAAKLYREVAQARVRQAKNELVHHE